MKTQVSFIAAFFVFLLCISTTLAAAQDVETSKSTYSVKIVMDLDGAAIGGEITEVCQIKDGSIVAVGSTGFVTNTESTNYADLRTEGDLNSTALVVKYNADGTIAFLKTFGGNKDDRFNNVIATSDGGFIALGYSSSFTGGDFSRFSLQGPQQDGSAIMVKYDNNGNALWAVSGYPARLHHFIDIAERNNGELCAMGCNIGNTELTYYSLRLNSNGKFIDNTPYQKILSGESVTIDAFSYAEDGSLYICGLQRDDGYFSKYSPDGVLEFTKVFVGDGQERYMGMVLTSDGNIIVNGGFSNSTSGKGFDSIGAKKSEINKSSGCMVVKYSPDGKELGGNILVFEQNEGGFDLSKRLISLDNGGALFYCTSTGNFKDPLSGKIIQKKSQQAYFYRIGKNGKFEYLYKISSDLFFGVYNGVHSIKKLNDGAFRIISAENGNSSRVRVFDVPDKFRLQETIDSTLNLKMSDYSTDTWNNLVSKLYYANQVNISTRVTQADVNKAANNLKSSIINLKNKKNEPPSLIAGETSSAILDISESTDNNELDSSTQADGITSENALDPSGFNNDAANSNQPRTNPMLFFWIAVGCVFAGGAGIGAYFLINKQKKSKTEKDE
ncbi:MAG: hypothetical protein PHH84_00635 [Oscillospiraceae bacterium]|nr:hypothetical protein [Oscillospiraceae bacterium]MDD4413025.1 hypothetical protein [Oscillospiraceae bacterium]